MPHDVMAAGVADGLRKQTVPMPCARRRVGRAAEGIVDQDDEGIPAACSPSCSLHKARRANLQTAASVAPDGGYPR